MGEYVFAGEVADRTDYIRLAGKVSQGLEAYDLSFEIVCDDDEDIAYHGTHFTGGLEYQEDRSESNVVATFSGDGCQNELDAVLEGLGFASNDER